MKVLVCGHREFDDWSLLCDELQNFLRYPDLVIIEGEAKGADFLARVWAKHHSIPYEAYPADWKTYGVGAGPIRNKEMLVKGKPNLVIAFLSKGSKGTANMLKQAKEANVETIVVNI